MATTKEETKATPKPTAKKPAKRKESAKNIAASGKGAVPKANPKRKTTAQPKSKPKKQVSKTASGEKTPAKLVTRSKVKSKAIRPKSTAESKVKPAAKSKAKPKVITPKQSSKSGTKPKATSKNITKSKSKPKANTKVSAKSTPKKKSAAKTKPVTSKAKRKNARRPVIIMVMVGIMMLLVIGGAIAGVAIHKNRKNARENEQREAVLKAGPLVRVAEAKYNDGSGEIVLIAEARPYQTATLYAKISGYLQSITVDKGDNVVAGQLLAIVDNPEIDQQYNAAVADMVNKKKISERDTALLDNKFIAQEEADISQTNANMARDNVRSLAEQQQYKMIRAPFTGTITARYVDDGALIQNAINSQTSSQPVVTIEELGRLRIYAYVEQKDAAFLRIGDSVEITIPEKPDIHIKSTITRISGDLDAHTRMMLTEVDIQNIHGVIVPGSYVQVHFKIPKDAANKNIIVPTEALVFHQTKTMVATIDKDSTLHFKQVKIGDNTGETVTILTGLQEGDRVALSIGENLAEGRKVRITK